MRKLAYGVEVLAPFDAKGFAPINSRRKAVAKEAQAFHGAAVADRDVFLIDPPQELLDHAAPDHCELERGIKDGCTHPIDEGFFAMQNVGESVLDSLEVKASSWCDDERANGAMRPLETFVVRRAG